MKLLHTSDWHLGRRLYDYLRTDEFEAFFAWLNALILKERPDGIVVAGDIFDNANPSTHSIKTFTEWLTFCADHGVKVFVVGGNHDSANFLESVRTLAKRCDAWIVGRPSENVADDVASLTTSEGDTAVLGLVPFLNRTMLPEFEVTSDPVESQRRVGALMGDYYQTVRNAMREVEAQFEGPLLTLMTGHCFVTGGTVESEDGVERALSVGSLGEVSDAIFPADVDYVALGHLHRAQSVAGNDHHRYSGTPLPMSFSESEQSKSVVIMEWTKANPTVELRFESIPNFRRLARLKGDEQKLVESIKALAVAQRDAETHAESTGGAKPLPTWVEVHFASSDGAPAPTDLRATLEREIDGQSVVVLNIVDENRQRRQDVLMSDEMQLERLTPARVFEERLKTGAASHWSDDEKADARQKFQFIMDLIQADKADEHAPAVATDVLEAEAK